MMKKKSGKAVTKKRSVEDEDELDSLAGPSAVDEDEDDDEEEEGEDDDDEEEEEGEDDDDDDEDDEEEEEGEDDDDDDDDDDDEEEEEGEDDDDEEDKPAKGKSVESPPPPGKKGKNKKEKVYSYTVTKSFEKDGRSYVMGETIPVTCATCAFWQLPINGEVYCSPENVINEKTGLTMSPERYSCESFYLNIAHSDLLQKYLAMGFVETSALHTLLRAHQRMLTVKQKVREFATEHGVDGGQVLAEVEEWIGNLTHHDEIKYFANFAAAYPKIIKKSLKAPKLAYTSGSWVSWTDPDKRIAINKGVIIKLSKGNIYLAVADEGWKGKRNFDYDFKRWKETCSPRILKMGVEE